jgi:predicted ABC-type ATPase
MPRHELVEQRESFVFEIVFSVPVGEKLAFLKNAAKPGYNTILCFIGGAWTGGVRNALAMRVS